MRTGVWAGLAAVTAAGVGTLVALGVTGQADIPAPSAELVQDQQVIEPGSADSWRMPVASPWAPGASVTITATAPVPGETIRVGQCTVAYSFTAGERAYAVTASHCGSPGDFVWATVDGLAADFAAPVGSFAYSDLYDPAGRQLDVGIIEITDPDYPMRSPEGQPPTVVATGSVTLPAMVCKFGATTGETCGQPLDSAGLEILADHDGAELRALASTAQVCARAGDSGGPVYADLAGRRVIIGLVSGTRDAATDLTCDDPAAGPMTMSYTSMSDIQDVIDRVVPDAEYRSG